MGDGAKARAAAIGAAVGDSGMTTEPAVEPAGAEGAKISSYLARGPTLTLLRALRAPPRRSSEGT